MKERPPIKKNCPDCNDTGWVECRIGKIPCKCKNAEWNYLTPEQWEAETGEKMLDSDPVWIQTDFWDLSRSWVLIESRHIKQYKAIVVIVARPGQPKPPEDYKL